jgi:hypothetical protein
MNIQTGRVGNRATRGTEELWRALKKLGWSQGRLARELSAVEPTKACSSGLVNKWLHADQAPKAVWAKRIETALGGHGFKLPAHLWGETLDRPMRMPSVPPPRAA